MVFTSLSIKIMRGLKFYNWNIITAVRDSFCGENDNSSCYLIPDTNNISGFMFYFLNIILLPVFLYSWYIYHFIDLYFLLSATLLYDLVLKFCLILLNTRARPDEVRNLYVKFPKIFKHVCM